MPLFDELQQLMLTHRFRPEQKFSQHFVIDERLIKKMVECAELKSKDVVLEIGSGTGTLTEALLEHCKVIGVEHDEVLAQILREEFSGSRNFALAESDFLKIEKPKSNKVVALPPYAISTEIMLKLFGFGFEKAVLVFQREFVDKLVAEPGFYEYNYLSVLSSLLYDAQVPIYNISPKSFYPKPEAYSSLVVLTAKKKQPKIKDFKKFILFLKSIFRFKNKNLKNALKSCAKELESRGGINEKKALKALEKSKISAEKVYLIEPGQLLEFFKKIA